MHNCVVVRKDRFDQTLSTPNDGGSGVRALEPLKSLAAATGFPLRVLEDHDTQGQAEVHTQEGDLWVCLEGMSTFTIGGSLFEPQHQLLPSGEPNPHELFAATIKDGETVTLHPGDWLWVPAGEPHQHGASGVARLGIIKIPKN